jgi:hypothetical protein
MHVSLYVKRFRRMVRLPVIVVALILPGRTLAQPTDDAAKCQAAAGSYLTGTVVSGPSFKPGVPLRGTYLSHSHLTLRSDADGRAYDVAIDNVFANGYHHNQRSVPAPLNTIKVGDRLELCGQLYTGGDVGIHWVHTDCGATPSPDKPDGWVREINKDGSVGDNMEASQDFCSLWPN